MYAESVNDPEGFWGREGKRLDWIKPYTKVKNTSFKYPDVSIKWFEDGQLNVSVNCVDRHLRQTRQPNRDHLGKRRPDQRQAHHLCRAVREREQAGQRDEGTGRQEGRPRRALHADDPRSRLCDAGLHPHRCGPFHRLRRLLARSAGRRINDSAAKLVITADEAPRGGRANPLKANVDKACAHHGDDVRTLVVEHTGGDVPMTEGQDHSLHRR